MFVNHWNCYRLYANHDFSSTLRDRCAASKGVSVKWCANRLYRSHLSMVLKNVVRLGWWTDALIFEYSMVLVDSLFANMLHSLLSVNESGENMWTSHLQKSGSQSWIFSPTFLRFIEVQFEVPYVLVWTSTCELNLWLRFLSFLLQLTSSSSASPLTTVYGNFTTVNLWAMSYSAVNISI